MLKTILGEHYEQAAVVTWARDCSFAYPELAMLFAIPNGGRRSIGVARKMKAEGLKAGVPDLFLPVPRGTFHGLFIEMKAGNGRTSPEQKECIHALTEQGYRVEVCVGAQNAIIVINDYLGIKEGK